MHDGFIFQVNKCTGCQACRLACTMENRLPPDRSFRRVNSFNPRRVPGIRTFHLSLACNHCEKAPCMEQCPARAIERDLSTWTVQIQAEKCLGCGYCTWACPYDAPRLDPIQGIAEKCNLCADRIRCGQAPACVSLCPTGALGFGSLEGDPCRYGEGFPESDAEPRIRIIPVEAGDPGPICTAAVPPAHYDVKIDLPPSRITVESEWPLVAFSLLAAVLVALFAGLSGSGTVMAGFAFGAALLAAMGLALLHLGKRGRAPRAIRNAASSWLSREIFFYSLFAFFSILSLLLYPPAGWLALAFGFLSLLAVDQVYRFTVKPLPGYLHSSHTLLTGLFLAGIFTGSALLVAIGGLSKLFLYLFRKVEFHKQGRDPRMVLSLLRLGLGFVVPTFLWAMDPSQLGSAMIACVILGELVDRCEFYEELEILSPQLQMVRDLETRMKDVNL